MNSIGLSLLFRMGCICVRESLDINGSKYYVRGRLGEGGFSSVDLVEDLRTHKTYALKRITCHSESDERQAFQEIEYHKCLQHSYILECVDSAMKGSSSLSGNKTSEVLILLPYYSRGTLHDELQRKMGKGEFFSEEYVLQLFKKVCEAVKVMHNAKPHPLSHRDLKPANILLSEDQCPVIMDLGSMGKARHEIKSSAEAMQLQDLAAERCSMAYRAPELFNVESFCQIDERTDIWSLGCVLYALCFYKSPFDAIQERGDSVALAVVSGNIEFPENSPYGKEMEELILFLLKVDMKERPFIDEVIEKVDQRIRDARNAV